MAKPKTSAGRGSNEIVKAVAELREWVKALQKRPDVLVVTATIHDGASASDLKYADMPANILPLYAEMDGASIEWRFRDDVIGGRLSIPPLEDSDGFQGDSDSNMNFGGRIKARVFDENTESSSTWIVRAKADADGKLVYAANGDGKSGVEVAASVAEYLREGMSRGFIEYWPDCFRKKKGALSMETQEEAIARFRAKPKEPAKAKAGAKASANTKTAGGGLGGARVDFDSHLGRGRATVIATSANGRFPSVHLQCDDGSSAWLTKKEVTAAKDDDAYARLQRSGIPIEKTATAVRSVFADLTRALGPLGYGTSSSKVASFPTTARRAAGLLSGVSAEKAAERVVQLFEATTAAKVPLDERAKLKKNGSEFFAGEHYGRWETVPREVLYGLLAGVTLRALVESAQSKTPLAKVLPAATTAKLTTLADHLLPDHRGEAYKMLAMLKKTKPAVLPYVQKHSPSPDTLKDYGVPKGSQVGMPELG